MLLTRVYAFLHWVQVEVELLVINVMGRAAWEEGDIKRRTLLISTGL
jgi:hypothetical protein